MGLTGVDLVERDVAVLENRAEKRCVFEHLGQQDLLVLVVEDEQLAVRRVELVHLQEETLLSPLLDKNLLSLVAEGEGVEVEEIDEHLPETHL